LKKMFFPKRHLCAGKKRQKIQGCSKSP